MKSASFYFLTLQDNNSTPCASSPLPCSSPPLAWPGQRICLSQQVRVVLVLGPREREREGG